MIAAPAAAQENRTQIDGGGVTGVTTVNAASGNNNQQLNVGTIVDGALATSSGSASQILQESGNASGASATTIAPNAFAASSGWTAINGVSGNDNQQANMAAFAFGIEAGAVADTTLSQSRASMEPAGAVNSPAAEPIRTVAIGEGAFGNSSGLVQVGLIGGDRNSSANTFALSVSGGAGQ